MLARLPKYRVTAGDFQQLPVQGNSFLFKDLVEKGRIFDSSIFLFLCVCFLRQSDDETYRKSDNFNLSFNSSSPVNFRKLYKNKN